MRCWLKNYTNQWLKNSTNFKDKNCAADLTEMGLLKIMMLNIYYESYTFSPKSLG